MSRKSTSTVTKLNSHRYRINSDYSRYYENWPFIINPCTEYCETTPGTFNNNDYLNIFLILKTFWPTGKLCFNFLVVLL